MEIRKKLIHCEGDFLADDFGPTPIANYPYPARLPTFLAAIGLIEVTRWPKVSCERMNSLRRLIDAISQGPSAGYLPAAYKNKELEIVPLRLAWSEPRGAHIRKSIEQFIHVPWTWFMAPIIATHVPLENLGYIIGTCPISEGIGPNMVNIPCIFDKKDTDRLISALEEACS